MKRVDIIQARDLLLSGDVVAIPTETVYGLAGWIYSDLGLKKIFAVKERPFFDPLIVHVDTTAKAKALTREWTIIHENLANALWPGPLTLIAKKNDLINPLITSGLDSVGLRCPKHSETLKLLSLIPGGLAAPSANKFGKTSPTLSSHVFDEFGESVSILEGGSCEIGIESTVVGVEKVNETWKVLIYRPGFYTAQDIKKILDEKNIKSQVDYAQSPVAPGQLKHHYMPNIPLIIISEKIDIEMAKKKIENRLNKIFTNPVLWKLPIDPRLASRKLYQDLRIFSSQGHDLILMLRDTRSRDEEWVGVWNRLEKAKTFEISEDGSILE